MIVVVLGVRRAGTSLVAHLLSEMGIEMGRFNGRGAESWEWRKPIARYYEDQEILRFNMKLLRAAGGTWTHPPELHRLPEAAKTLELEMDELIATHAERSEWGFKDPRTTLTVFEWHRRLQYWDRDIRYVRVLRKPQDIAKSNMKSKWRNGLKSKKAYVELVEYYWNEIERFAETVKPVPRVQAVEFEKLVDVRTAETEVRKLCHIVAKPFSEELMQVINYR